MSGEIVEGKRTVVAREGHADFAPPPGHEISVGRDGSGKVVSATLRWGDHNSSFFASLEERESEVIVKLHELMGSTGYAVAGEGQGLGQVLPYPFPDDLGPISVGRVRVGRRLLS